MMRKLPLLILLLLMGVGIVQGQTLITPESVSIVDITSETQIRVTGQWDDTALGSLKTKLATRKTAITKVDMNEATFAGDITSGFQKMFNGFSKLANVTLPTAGHSGEIVLTDAFSDCTSLESVDISGFKYISDLRYAFYDCKNLTSVTLPANGTTASSIAFNGTFNGCSSLVSLDISMFKNISSLSGVFSYCLNLTGVTLPEEGTTAGKISFYGIFYGCSSLESMNISMFKNISDLTYAFSGCTNLTSVTLPTNGTTESKIPFYAAFQNCSSLVSLDISMFKNISSLSNVFSGCRNLTGVTLPTNGTTVSSITFYRAFESCLSLASLDISMFENISNLSYAFQDCPALTSVYISSVPASNYIDTFKNANPTCVKFIGQQDFDNTNYNWTNIVLPFDDDDATANPANMVRITMLEDSVWNNAALTSLSVALKNFDDKTVFTQADFSKTALATDITDGFAGMFKGFTNLKTVTFPTGDSPYSIVFAPAGSGGSPATVSFAETFAGCAALESIDLSMFTTIGDMNAAFQGCTALTGVVLSCALIGDSKEAFDGANPNCLKYIATASFDNTSSWTNVILRNGSEWQATTDMELKDTAPFHAPESFTMAAGKTITYIMRIADCKTVYNNGEVIPRWATIALPFDAQIANLRLFDGESGNYILREFITSTAIGEATFTDVKAEKGTTVYIKANTPYLISFLGAGLGDNAVTANHVTFVATAQGIAATPEAGVVAGEGDILFRSNYRPMANTETGALYVLADEVSSQAFKLNSNVALSTFQAHFTDILGTPGGAIDIVGDDVLTSLKPATPQGAISNGISVYANGAGSLRIESDRPQQVILYTATGMVVRMIVLNEGTNYVNGLQPGIYIIGGKKVVM